MNTCGDSLRSEQRTFQFQNDGANPTFRLHFKPRDLTISNCPIEAPMALA